MNILKQIRKSLGFTQREMALKLGLEAGTYTAYEYGSRNPAPEVIEKAKGLLPSPEKVMRDLGALSNAPTSKAGLDYLQRKIDDAKPRITPEAIMEAFAIFHEAVGHRYSDPKKAGLMLGLIAEEIAENGNGVEIRAALLERVKVMLEP